MARNVSAEAEQEAPDRLLTARRSRSLVILIAIAAGIVVCYLLAVPFLPALTWALVLAIMFHPLHRRIAKDLRHPEIAAAATVAIAAFIVAVPLMLIAERLVNEAAKGAQIIAEALRTGSWRDAIANYPRIGMVLLWIETQLDLAGLAGNAATLLTNFSAILVRRSVVQIIDLVLTFYFLFYFLRDGREALAMLKNFSPLTSAEMNKLFLRVSETVYAIVFGTFAVAIVQGTLGGLMFWLLGLPSPLLWGLAMGLLAMVPVLGAFIIWIPAALSLALTGEWGKALILTVWGAGVVATVDNLLYPMFVGERLKLHTVVAFMSMIGGIIVFGPAGLVIGPVTFTVTLLLLDIWRAYARESDSSSPPPPL
ncbi:MULTISPECIES: AI-2E family transporter [Sinorhizobium]|uniref:AI-2E family transporter n=1 Tax=Sinorhizobium TaxID=28105 RepID=UPI000BE8C380|nr:MULTISPECIES: AI-2E family transporter [Sinorhizobium]PDT53176.1 AI-2E family transporter [Sinorhizobium sp. NG07B]POH29344.1 AI-2E family transporter [Sinorhizobium americanum]